MTHKIQLRDFSLLIALVAIVAFFSINEPSFLGARNLSKLMVEFSMIATLAIGMLLIIVPGHIDLSVGSGVGMLGGLAAVLIFQHHIPAPVAMGIALIAGGLIWMGMGWLVVHEKIPAFIITLGGLMMFKGIHWRIIGNSTIPVSVGGESNLISILTTYYIPTTIGLILAVVGAFVWVALALKSRNARRDQGLELEDKEIFFFKLFLAVQLIFLFVLTSNLYQGIPLAALILLTVALSIHWLTRNHRFGRYLYAIGGNEEAARLSGVPVAKTIIGAFAIMGLLVAVTGFMQTAFSGASTTTTGQLLELDAIAACVIGGTSLKGGRGTVLGVLFGALIMTTLINGMFIMSVDPTTNFIARGLVLTLAVWMDVRWSKK